jgi:hypothetical protein
MHPTHRPLLSGAVLLGLLSPAHADRVLLYNARAHAICTGEVIRHPIGGARAPWAVNVARLDGTHGRSQETRRSRASATPG